MKLLKTSLAVLLSTSAAAQADNIVYGSFLPPTHGTNAVVMPLFAEVVSDRTGGATTVEIVTGGALSSAKDSLSSVASGVIDATPLVYSYTPTELPAHTFVGEVFTADHRVAGPAATETVLLGCPSCVAEADALGVKVLANPAGGGVYFMCKDGPIVTPDDLDGLQFRSSGSSSALVQSLGGTPINMSFTEIYEALQRGQLDCNLVAATELESSQMWDVTKYVTDLSLGTFNSFSSFTINADTWAGLSDEARAAILDASAQGLAADMNFVSQKYAEVRDIAAAEHGVQFVAPDETLVEAVSAYRASELAGQIATALDRGVADAADVADYFAGAVAKWTAIVDEIGADDAVWSEDQQAAYLAAIRAEIYEKVDAAQ